MVVESVRVHMLSSQHVVILREAERERYLPIWIGSWEAQAIAMKLQGVAAERPLTHDLLADMLTELSVDVLRIVVSDLADETYRARIVIDHDGSTSEVDARPSDAIALALRTRAPIFVEDSVLDNAKTLESLPEKTDADRLHKWLESLDPDDFEYKM
jgi:bifunctional DNase/RNase